MKPCAVSWLTGAPAHRRQKRAAMSKAQAESFGARKARAERELPACVRPSGKAAGTSMGHSHDWSYNLPKKMRKRAMCAAISERLREGNLVIVNDWKLDAPKTREFLNMLGTLKLNGKTLIVDSLKNTNLMLASRNVQTTKVVNSYGVNIYDLVNHQKLVLTPKTVEELTDILKPRAKDDEEGYRPREDGETRPPRRLPGNRGAAA